MSRPSKTCLQRLQTELRKIQKEEAATAAAAAAASSSTSSSTSSPSPSPSSSFITARPDPDNILDWYFLVHGPEATPYAGGRYMGRLQFPTDYPFKAPKVMMLSPSGRFATDTAICMSNTSFHPEEWNPMWEIRTIIAGLVSFMAVDEVGLGGVTESTAQREKLAKESASFNVDQLKYIFQKVMPEQFAREVAMLGAEAERAAAAATAAEKEREDEATGSTITAAAAAGHSDVDGVDCDDDGEGNDGIVNDHDGAVAAATAAANGNNDDVDNANGRKVAAAVAAGLRQQQRSAVPSGPRRDRLNWRPAVSLAVIALALVIFSLLR